MTQHRPADPTVLDPAGIAYHQLLAFSARPELVDALERSPLFRVRLIQPLHDAGDEPLTAREVAADYLRMAWAWIPREDLGGRAPASVVGTGRGRALLEPLLDTLARALRSEIPTFPAMSSDELHEILLPEARPEAPAPSRPRSARKP